MTEQHDAEQLAAYAAGLLDGADARSMETHLAGCGRCRRELAELREVDAALRGLPAELFLDGPPPGGEQVLQRTLRQIRRERGARRTGQRLRLVAAALVALVAVGAAGVAIGRRMGTETITTTPPAPAAPNARRLTGFNPSLGAHLTVAVTPAAGWVRVKATVVGIPAGQRCTLVVMDHSRNRYTAASWLASAAGEHNAITIEGAAIVAPADLAAVAVQTDEHRELVIAPG